MAVIAVTAALACITFALIAAAAAVIGLVIYALTRPRASYGVPRGMSESAYAWRAEKMLAETREAVKRSRLPNERKSAVMQESKALYDNIIKSVWKLKRVRTIRELARKGVPSADSARILQDADDMERRVLDDLNHAMDVLLSVPASLVRLEMAADDREIERLVNNLDDANLRMREQAEAYDDMRDGSFPSSQSQAAPR